MKKILSFNLFISFAIAKAPENTLISRVYGSKVAQQQLSALRERIASQDQNKLLQELNRYDAYNREVTNSASKLRDYHEKARNFLQEGNPTKAAALLKDPNYQKLLNEVNYSIKKYAPSDARNIPTVTAPPTDPSKLGNFLGYPEKIIVNGKEVSNAGVFELQFNKADSAISKRVSQLKYDAYLKKVFEQEKLGNIKILSVRTDTEANNIHNFVMERASGGPDAVRPYTDGNTREPVLTIEDTKGVLEVVGIKDVDSKLIINGDLDPKKLPKLGSYLTPPADDKGSSSRIYDEQGAAREDTASRNRGNLNEDQVFIKGKLKPGSVVQLGPVGPQPDSPDYFGQGSDIQFARQRLSEETLRLYEQNPNSHADIEKFLSLSVRARRSGRDPVKFPPLSDAEKVALAELPEQLKKKYGIDLSSKANNEIDVIRFSIGTQSRMSNVQDVGRLLTDYVKEQNPQKSAQLRQAAQGLIEDLDVLAQKRLASSSGSGPDHDESVKFARDVEVLKNQLGRYSKEKGDVAPTFRKAETRNISSQKSGFTPKQTEDFNNSKSVNRINTATQLAMLAFKVARGESLDTLDKAGLVAAGIAEANILATAQLIKSDKTFAKNLAAATGITSRALGGLLAGVGLYQGSKDALEEIKKINAQDLIDAFKNLDSSKFKSAFANVDKEKLAVGSTVAVTSGAGLITAITGGAGAAALVAETGGSALFLYGGYKGSEALRAHLINVELQEQDAIKKRFADLAVDAHNATLKKIDSYVSKPINASAKDISEACDITLDASEFMPLVSDDEIKGQAGKDCNFKARSALNNFEKNQAFCRETPSRICPSGIEACKAAAAATKEFREKGPIASDGTLLRVGALSNFVICQNQAASWAMNLQNSLFSSKNESSFTRLAASVDPANKNLGISGTRFIALVGKSAQQQSNERFDAYVKANASLVGDLKGRLLGGKGAKSYCEGAFDINEAIYARSLRLLNRCSELTALLLAELTPEESAYVKKLFAQSGLNEQGFRKPKSIDKKASASDNSTTEEHKK